MSRLQRLWLILGGLFLTLAIGVMVLLFWLSSAGGQIFLKHLISQKIESEFNFQTDIDSIKLDLFSQVVLNGLVLENIAGIDTTRLEVAKLSVRYSLSGLFAKHIKISSIDIGDVQVQVRTDSTSNWLLGDLPATSDNSDGSTWTIEVQHLELAQAFIDIGDRQSGFALLFPALSLDVTGLESGQYDYDITGNWQDESTSEPRFATINAAGSLTKATFLLEHFTLFHPDFELESHLGFTLTDNVWTDQSDVHFNGSPTALLKPIFTYMDIQMPSLSGTIDAVLSMNRFVTAPDVKFTINSDAVKINDFPYLDGTLSGLATTQAVTLDTFDVVLLNTPLHGKGYFSFDSLSSFALSGNLPATPIEASLGEYYGSGDDYTGIVSGQFQGSGQLLKIQDANMKATFDILQASWLGKPIKNTTLYASLDQGRAALNFNQGRNQLQITALLDSLEKYQANLSYNLPDLAPIMSYTPAVGLSGKVVGSAEVRYANDSFVYQADLRGKGLEYQGVRIDKTHFKVKGIDKEWTILDGEISSRESNLAVVNRFINAPVLSGRATYQARVKGTLEDLSGGGTININSFGVDGFTLDSVYASLDVKEDVITLINASAYLNDQRVLANGTANWRGINGLGMISIENRVDSKWLLQGSLALQARKTGKGASVSVNGKNVDLTLLSYVPSDYNQFAGLVDFSSTVRLGSTLEAGQLYLNGEDIYFHDQYFQSIRLSAYLDSTMFRIDTLEMKHESEQVFVTLEIPIDLKAMDIRNRSPLKATIQSQALDLMRFQTILPENLAVSGHANASIRVEGNWYSPHFYGSLDMPQVDVDYPGFPHVLLGTFASEFDGQRVYLRNIDIAVDSREVVMSGQADIYNQDNYFLKFDLDGGSQGKAHLNYQNSSGVIAAGVQLENTDLSIVKPFLELGQDVGGVANGKLWVKDMSGDRILRGNMSVSNGFVRLASDIPAIQNIDLGISITPNRLGIKRFTGNMDNLPFSAHGYVEHQGWDHFKIDQLVEISDVPSLTLRGTFSTTSLDLNLGIPTMNLSAWRPLFPTVEKLSGVVQGNLFIKGTPGLPQLDGELFANGLAMDLPYFEPALSQGKIAAHFQDQSIRLDSLSFRQGKTGRIFLAGEYEYFDTKQPRFDIRLIASRIKLKEANVIKGEISDLKLTYGGQDERYQLKGGAKLGSISIQQRVTPKDLLKMVAAPDQAKPSQLKILTQTKVYVKIDESDQLSVQNNLAHIRLKTDLMVLGSLAQPIPTGRVSIQEGYVLYLDRRFVVTKATLDFQNQYELNPIVDLHAKAQLKPYQTRSKKEYTIYIDLTGPMDKADFVLRSEPALDRTDILTLLTMGATRQELSLANPGLDNAKIGKILQDRLSDYSSQKISAYTADRIGTFMNLDNISIEGDLFNFGSSWGPELVASKKVGEKTTLTYSTSVGQATKQNVKLEYELTEGVSIEGQTDQKGRSGLDLKFGWKFK